jgi:hypothetical protein
MVAQPEDSSESPRLLSLSGIRYVGLINMTDQAFPSHGSLHPQLR